jgi:hypothetical protein
LTNLRNVREPPAGTIRIVADPIKPNQAGLPPPKLAQAVPETAKDFAKEAIFEKRPYLKMAFSNPYNLSLLGGALAASVLTLNPVLALGALGAEAIWLLHGPDNPTLRRLLWDPRKRRRVACPIASNTYRRSNSPGERLDLAGPKSPPTAFLIRTRTPISLHSMMPSLVPGQSNDSIPRTSLAAVRSLGMCGWMAWP